MKARLYLLILLLISSVTLTNCDDPNTPDTPALPYSLKATYTTRGLIRDVHAQGDLAAVADDAYGAVLLNVANLEAIDSIWNYEGLPSGSLCYRVILDPEHQLLGARTNTIAGGFPVYNYETGAFTFSINLGTSVDVRDIAYVSTPDSINVYAIDSNDGFVATRYCRANSSSPWQFGCGLNWQSWRPPLNEIRGFSRREDNVFAIAIGEEGLHFHDANLNTTISDLALPGVAYDCAWYGANTVVVVAQYYVFVVDASAISAPHLLATLSIPGADRMRQVVVQGTHAIILDSNDGLYIVDVANTSSPKLVQTVPLIDPVSIDAEPAGNRLYVADQAQGLLVYSRQ